MPKRKPATDAGTTTRRFIIRGDDSGHEYAIPVELDDEFDGWVEWTCNYCEGDYDGHDFEGCRIDGRFTFADPRIGDVPIELPYKA